MNSQEIRFQQGRLLLGNPEDGHDARFWLAEIAAQLSEAHEFTKTAANNQNMDMDAFIQKLLAAMEQHSKERDERYLKMYEELQNRLNGIETKAKTSPDPTVQ